MGSPGASSAQALCDTTQRGGTPHWFVRTRRPSDTLYGPNGLAFPERLPDAPMRSARMPLARDTPLTRRGTRVSFPISVPAHSLEPDGVPHAPGFSPPPVFDRVPPEARVRVLREPTRQLWQRGAIPRWLLAGFPPTGGARVHTIPALAGRGSGSPLPFLRSPRRARE